MARHTPSRGHESWPSLPLEAAQEAFAWLTAGEQPVSVNGRLFDHLPDRAIPVDELRELLLARDCPRRVWDQVWAHVIGRSRLQGATWTVVAVGLALPMLTSVAIRLTARYQDDPADVQAEILQGFLEAARSLNLSRGGIAARLRWAAFRAGRRAVLTTAQAPQPKAPGFESQAPRPEVGHPDLVLARAINAGVLSQAEADLISTTRLDRRRLTQLPNPHGLSYEGLRSWRRRAEERLVAWLLDTEPAGPESDSPAEEGPTERSDESEPRGHERSRKKSEPDDRSGRCERTSRARGNHPSHTPTRHGRIR